MRLSFVIKQLLKRYRLKAVKSPSELGKKQIEITVFDLLLGMLQYQNSWLFDIFPYRKIQIADFKK
jgi:hypothetical protein